MKLVEIDKKLLEDISQQPVQEGPFDWMLRSSRIGQWLAARDGKKAQREMATMYIQALSKWRGFTGNKKLTPEVLVTWLKDSQRNFGLGLPENEIAEILADAGVKKALAGPTGPGGMTPSLGNNKIKEFITALSRVNFDEVTAASKTVKTPAQAATTPLSTVAKQTTATPGQPAQAPAQAQTQPATTTAPAQTQAQPATATAPAQAQQDPKQAAMVSSIEALAPEQLVIIKKMLAQKAKAPTESVEEAGAGDILRSIGRGVGKVAGAVAGAPGAISKGIKQGFQSGKSAVSPTYDFEELKREIVNLTPAQAKQLISNIQKMELVNKSVVKAPAAKQPARAEPKLDPAQAKSGQAAFNQMSQQLRTVQGGKQPGPAVWKNPRTGEVSSTAPGSK
jgi:hypothetical protein